MWGRESDGVGKNIIVRASVAGSGSKRIGPLATVDPRETAAERRAPARAPPEPGGGGPPVGGGGSGGKWLKWVSVRR